ncbi:hypothetical protein LTS15_011290 [Exophiala xenobiotica]|nr:hypothetical protein LTS15_011290 [Exophiala xenobiotica]
MSRVPQPIFNGKQSIEEDVSRARQTIEDYGFEIQDKLNRVVSEALFYQTALSNTKAELSDTKTELSNTKTELKHAKDEVQISQRIITGTEYKVVDRDTIIAEKDTVLAGKEAKITELDAQRLQEEQRNLANINLLRIQHQRQLSAQERTITELDAQRLEELQKNLAMNDLLRIQHGRELSAQERTAEVAVKQVNSQTQTMRRYKDEIKRLRVRNHSLLNENHNQAVELEEARERLDQADHLRCNICVDSMKTVLTSCCHGFCKTCLDRWLANPVARNRCPICRQRVRKMDNRPINLQPEPEPRPSSPEPELPPSSPEPSPGPSSPEPEPRPPTPEGDTIEVHPRPGAGRIAIPRRTPVWVQVPPDAMVIDSDSDSDTEYE